MKPNKKICPVCLEEIIDRHGNRRYHKECAWWVKLERSKRQFANQSLQVDSCWANEKILRELFYSNIDREEFDPQKMEDAGFDFKLYSSTTDKNGLKVFVMKHFGFSILKNEKIIIWKL